MNTEYADLSKSEKHSDIEIVKDFIFHMIDGFPNKHKLIKLGEELSTFR